MAITRLVAGMIGLVLALVPVTAQAKGGCAELRAQCEAAGFADTGGLGKGIKVIRDCMNPLMNGVQPPGTGKLPLPRIDAKIIAECKTAKSRTGKRSTAKATTVAGNSPAPVKPLPDGVEPGPNIVMILVDDFSMNLMPDDLGELARTMPNLAQMRREGMTFDNYFVNNSLCCPSRSTIFTGKLPHNNGVLTNTGPTGGVQRFNAEGNDERTFGVALQEQFYATAMMGKYLNGYEADGGGIPPGWTEWAVAGNAYSNFNYTINHNGELISPTPHMTDQLSLLGQEFIAGASDGPFFLELSTYSPHAPYTPPARYADAFMDVTYPRTPAFAARPDKHAPQWMQDIPELNRSFQKKIDEIFRMRVQSVAGVDDMIGDIRATLAELGLAEDTYVIFTGDNGYHLGEFSLRAGKMTPFDIDIKVPMVVVGPGVAAGSRVDHIAMTIDLYPTFADLAGLPASPDVDGHSLVPVLRGEAGPLRNIAVVEHERAAFEEGDPDASDPKAGDPPTYVALRMRDALYVEYLDGSEEVSYYDLTADPHQLKNIAHTLPTARLKALHEAAQANLTCKGAVECGAAQALTP
jgi:N-acetylglucosamine-6-sulfatase